MSMSATLQDCLRSKGSQYEIVRHPLSHSSVETAAAAHIPGDRLAKTVLLEDERGYVAAVLPSTYAVRLSSLWAQTGRQLWLAKEVDLRELFKDCDVGALPPVCTAYGMQTYLELVHMGTDQFLDLMDRAERARFARRMQGMPTS
jgi:Ala-tRNA(Pro) deacylase